MAYVIVDLWFPQGIAHKLPFSINTIFIH